MKKWFMFLLAVIGSSYLVSNMYIGPNIEVSEQFAAIYGQMNVQSAAYMMGTFTKWILPQMILCSFWGNQLEEDLFAHLPYILTRTKNPYRFYIKSYGKILCKGMISAGMFVGSLFLWDFLFIPSFQAKGIDFAMMGLWILYQALCLLFINIFSASYPAIYGIGILCGCEGICWLIKKAIVLGSLPKMMDQFLPISWVHFYDGVQMLQPHFGKGYLFLIGIMFVMVGYHVWRFPKKDIL